MRLLELQDDNKETKKLRSKGLLKDWKDIKGVLNYQSLLYAPKVICSKLISRHHNKSFVGHFGIKKT